MWVASIKVEHDCSIGNRCRKFNCISFSLPLTHWADKKYHYTSHRHTIEGNKNNVAKFLKDLKNDPRLVKMELSKNTVIIVEKRKRTDIPTAHYNPKIFFVKPVYVDKDGFETWDVASWEKKVLMEFIKELKDEKGVKATVEKFHNVPLDNIYFPKIMPKLSDKQREAYQLAIENGYYAFPRKIGLQGLAKRMKVSVSTYQEHLRRAEGKIMPSYL